jgi:hypothetical protein
MDMFKKALKIAVEKAIESMTLAKGYRALSELETKATMTS